MPLFKSLRRKRPRRLQPLIAYAVTYLLAAGVSVATPGNPFPHYLLFLVMPMGFLTGTVFGKACTGTTTTARSPYPPRQSMQLLLVLILLVSTSTSLCLYLQGGSVHLPSRAAYLESFRGPIAQAIRRAAPPGSTMAVWGFSAELFIDSEMVQSNRYGCTVWQIERNPLQSYFLREFLVDMRKTRPLLFVDAMAPGMFYMGPIERSRHGHDAFPEVARQISNDYQLVEEVNGVRIYRLKSSPGKNASS
jgi:hypothetical protein